MTDFRARKMKTVWTAFNTSYKQGKPTNLNFGRLSLEEYLQYHHKKYEELCHFCGEISLPIGRWLYEKV
ncbi:MAG: hypothetical protein KAS32_27670 [Candidatus Peribacteraceae bacterium]|nr:hypothetical protein [Candidatus Peribacteraceae bacterium]